MSNMSLDTKPASPPPQVVQSFKPSSSWWWVLDIVAGHLVAFDLTRNVTHGVAWALCVPPADRAGATTAGVTSEIATSLGDGIP